MRNHILWLLLALGTVIYLQGTWTAVPTGTQGTPRLADFAYPVALVIQSGQLWVVDHNNNRIVTVRGTQAQIVAGTGNPKASGDGGLAIEAGLFPMGIALDRWGNLYIADHVNNRIRQVTPQGKISTVVGTGIAGYTGDGGPALAAQLNDPTGVAVDTEGVLYIVDHENKRIRKVQQGVITTEVAQGLQSPWALAFDCQGNLLIADLGQDQILKWDLQTKSLTVVAGTGKTGFTGDGSLAVRSQLSSPVGLAVACSAQGQEVYVADSGNDRIRRIDPQGIIHTIAGNGTFGAKGDGGPATQAELGSPYAVALDEGQRVYIADANNGRVRRIDTQGQIETILSPQGANFTLTGQKPGSD